MPGNVKPAAPTTVMPKLLCSAFTEEIRQELLVNAYPDGSSERQALTINPRRAFKLSANVTVALWNSLYTFYRNQSGKPFYFYHLRETVPPFSWDGTGTATQGRYTVVFDGAWSETLNLGRSQISFNLREVA